MKSFFQINPLFLKKKKRHENINDWTNNYRRVIKLNYSLCCSLWFTCIPELFSFCKYFTATFTHGHNLLVLSICTGPMIPMFQCCYRKQITCMKTNYSCYTIKFWTQCLVISLLVFYSDSVWQANFSNRNWFFNSSVVNVLSIWCSCLIFGLEIICMGNLVYFSCDRCGLRHHLFQVHLFPCFWDCQI